MFSNGLKKTVAMGLLFLPVLAHAEQRLMIRGGGSATANVAISTLNRIAVQGDRIASIKGKTGQFRIEKDLTLGQIFIEPTPTEDKAPIHLYITTEQGYTYSLTLLCEDIPAENIILVSTSTENKLASWDKTASYESTIVNIIKSMHNQVDLEGFTSHEKSKNNYKITGLLVKNKESYIGDKLQGYRYEVENISDDDLEIKEADFYKSGVRAISILNKRLSPQDKTTVYVVRGV